MDSIAGTGLEGEAPVETPPPSLLVVVLDTNPYAWDELRPYLTLNQVVSDLLVFVNAHLACDHANRVAVLASHCTTTAWLYPTSPNHADRPSSSSKSSAPTSDPNKYRPFALIEHELIGNLRELLGATSDEDLRASPTSTTLAGSLTLAISYISKIASSVPAIPFSTTLNPDVMGNQSDQVLQNARILIVSTSGNLAAQYIPLMNLIFAAQHLHIPLDILKLAGDTVLLQQASYTTSGIFIAPVGLPGDEATKEPATGTTTERKVSLLPTLLFAFLPDPSTRRHLILPTAVNVDFRAACFCHRRVVSIGFVCSICLSIFCEEGVATYMRHAKGEAGSVTGTCLTCGTELSIKVLGTEEMVSRLPRKRMKKKLTQGDAQGRPIQHISGPAG